MAWWVIFNFVQMEKVSNCGAFDQNCGGFEKKIGGAFWRFLAQKGAVPDSEPLETLSTSTLFARHIVLNN